MGTSSAEPNQSRVERTVAANGMVTIDQIVSRVRVVPVAPEIFPKLQALLDDLDTEVADIARLIKLDAGLATSVLKTANSAFYARGEPVVDVEDAISRIGFDETFRLVVRCSYASVLRGDLTCYGISGAGLWREAVLTAFAMDHLCRKIGGDRAAGYATGLLHSVGMSAIDDYLKRQTLKVPKFEGAGRKAIVAWERETVGFDHAAVGAAMLRRWQVPPAIADAVARQHEEAIAEDDTPHTLVLPIALTLAEHVQALCDDSENPVAPFEPQYDPERLERLRLDEDTLAEITEKVCEVWKEARESIG